MSSRFEPFFAGLRENDPSLTELLFWGLDLIDEVAKALAEALEKNTTLTRVDLAGPTSIGDEGAKTIAEALERNTTLTRLALEGTSIGDEGATAIARALESNTTLTPLNLDCNWRIKDVGVKVIATMLETNATLTHLFWSGIDDDASIHNEDAIAIAEGLEYNTTLTHLDLIYNAIGMTMPKPSLERLSTTLP